MKREVLIAVVGAALLLAALPGYSQSGEEVREFAGQLEIGRPLSYRNLSVVPVFRVDGSGREQPAHCLTLDQALEQGVLEIREKDGGDVPWVVMSNRSDRRIFIMGGEILSGCKQDRIVARDVMIAPRRRRLAVPVYCVESGRWHHVSGSFGSEKNLGTYSIRAAAQGSSGNNQSEVWDKVAESNRKMGVLSATEAYQDAFRTEEAAKLVSDVEKSFKDLPGLGEDTVGVIIALGDRIIGVDIFDSAELFSRLWPKIIKSCVVALQGQLHKAEFDVREAEELLSALRWMRYSRQPGVDLGTEYSGPLSEFALSALVYGEGVVHLGVVSRADQ